MRNLTGAFASLACGLLVIGAIVGISAWSPWKSRAHAHELAWIERYAAWHAVIRRELPDFFPRLLRMFGCKPRELDPKLIRRFHKCFHVPHAVRIPPVP